MKYNLNSIDPISLNNSQESNIQQQQLTYHPQTQFQNQKFPIRAHVQ